MRRTACIVAFAVFAAAMSGISAAALPAEITIGAVETLTGDNAAYGLSIRSALELAVAEVNASGFLGGTRLRLVVMDDKADKQEGISVFTRLINDEKVPVIIGPTLSSTAFAADPIAQKAGVPVLGTSNTAKGITDMGNFIFRDSLPQAGVIPGTIAAVKEAYHPKKAALLFESTNEFSKSEADVFTAVLQQQGIQLVGSESYAKGDTDFRTQLGKLASRRPDILVLSSLVGEAIPVLQQAREIGITVPIVGGNGFNSPSVLANAKSAAEGLVVGSAWFVDSPAPKSRTFVAAYRAKYGKDPDQFGAQAYDGLYLVARAIKDAGSADRTAIRDALARIRSQAGALGSFSFDDHRDPVHPSVTLVVKDGRFVVFP
jgi:branched-chain amino acid transport system substrate-binding protein